MIDEFIKELQEEYVKRNVMPKIMEMLEKYFREEEEREKSNGFAQFNNIINNTKSMEFSNPSQPSIYTSPNAPVIQKSPDRIFEDKIMPAVNNTVSNAKDATSKAIDWLKNEPAILTNQKVDYSKPMNLHEWVTDALIKTAGKAIFPVSSDMYTDGMTNFSRAKQNPNAEIVNINDVKDENLKRQINEFGTKQNEKGVHYNSQSEASRLFSNSPEVKEFFRQNKEAIKRGDIKEQKFDFDTKMSDISKNTENFDRFASVQHGTLTNLGIDNKGRGTGQLIDRLDYNHRDVKDYKDIKNIINNYGYNMQEKENIRNYFSIIDILSDENNGDEITNLIKKLKKYFKL
ncbi:hypothetical protein IKQ21_03995 [bacterium]|nr:hypothetical protein [bacterium]